MIKVLKKKLDLTHSYVFLCGSYYNSSNEFDKRLILRKYIEKFNNLSPIIIDNAFNLDGFKDKTLKVGLMEEIIAKIAQFTIIIVESFSSSVELGLFSSSGKNNNILIVYA